MKSSYASAPTRNTPMLMRGTYYLALHGMRRLLLRVLRIGLVVALLGRAVRFVLVVFLLLGLCHGSQLPRRRRSKSSGSFTFASSASSSSTMAVSSRETT